MKRDIAIIGMSGKFPKSASIGAFWRNLTDAKELVHFYTDEELGAKGLDSDTLATPNFVKAASFVEGTNSFDYPFFKYTLDEAKIMNPQTRLMHQLVWAALEDAACDLERYHKKIGIFTGANNDLNWSLYSMLTRSENVDELTQKKISNPNYMSSLIAYKLNFKGPCYFIDTACSTSLSTAHLACRSLLLNECGIAVVGGIRLLSQEDVGYVYKPGSIMSNDGHTRSFGHNAAGTLGADGAGVVILKKLEEAIKDRDYVYAVIKGSAMNNDGHAKAGYTMPSVEGQSECIKLAHKIAGVKPADINYVEAHGTGTKIGDPIEIESLTSAFGTVAANQCAIGALKSNMGHADEAAGIAGLIKTVLAVKYKILPASLNYEKANPVINFAESPFYVNYTTTEWKRKNGKPLTAGISSFGIGGTNVHMVVQEKPDIPVQNYEADYTLVRYSAATTESLERYEEKLLHFLQQDKAISLVDLAYTLQVGRKRFGYGKWLCVRDKASLIAELEIKSQKTKTVSLKNQIVFMFSGQGSQYIGMGKQLYEKFTPFREVMDQGFTYLKSLEDTDFKRVLFDESSNEEINDTANTQPILFLFEYALAKLLVYLGVRPSYMIGHSLGEYVAACISGVFTFEDALKIVHIRARLMAGVAQGDMVSVGMPLGEVEPGLLGDASVAAINASESFVASGTKKDIAILKHKLAEKHVRFIDLKTSHAFHSTMMEAILGDFEKALQTIPLSKPQIPFIANTTGELITDEQAIDPAYWADHIVETVNFEKGIKRLSTMNHTVFAEVGPGTTLTSYFKQCQEDDWQNVALNTVRHPREKVDDIACLLEFVGNLWINGFDIDWDKFYATNSPHKISIPTYDFDTHEIPSKVCLNEMLLKKGLANPKVENTDDCFYMPSWKQTPQLVTDEEAFDIGGQLLLFTDNSLFCKKLTKRLGEQAVEVVTVQQGEQYNCKNDYELTLNPDDINSFVTMAAHISSIGFEPKTVIFAWGLTHISQSQSDNCGFQTYLGPFISVCHIIKSLSLHERSGERKVVFMSSQCCLVTGAEQANIKVHHVSKLLQAYAQESPNVLAAHIDLGGGSIGQQEENAVLEELKNTEGYYQVAYRNGRRWMPCFEPIVAINRSAQARVRVSGNYLITGGVCEVGYALAHHLLSNYEANVFLVSGLSSSHSGQTATANKMLKTLRALRGKLTVIQCNISEYESLLSSVEDIEKQFGKINGIIHTAKYNSVEGMVMASEITEETIAQHFLPRVNGLLNIIQVFKDRNTDFVKVFSSLSSILGGVFYGAYAASATLMDDIALQKGDVAVINLDRIADEAPWLKTEQLVAAFYRSFERDTVQLVVSNRDINLPQEKALESITKQSENKAQINRTTLKSEYEPPENEIETEVVRFFEGLFGMKGIGAEDDFFEMGGDSLKGMILINRFKKEMGVDISITDMFSNKSPRALALLIAERKWLAEGSLDSAHSLVI